MNHQALEPRLAERIAALALDSIHREYPNKISHVLTSDADAAPPRQLTPAFYGCYDWHSAVHNHWLLARLARLLPDAPFAGAARRALRQSLTRQNVAAEIAYLDAAGRQSFERPYGLAWLLLLALELDEANDAWSIELSANLLSLERNAVARLSEWLSKLTHPVRSGEHSQTAFALGLMLDYARGKNDASFTELLVRRATDFYFRDRECPLHYEPSGEDFLSPGLAEADLVRRLLAPPEFASWLSGFFDFPLPVEPVVSPDRGDPKFSHLDGLNLSRAWMMEGVACGLPQADPRRTALQSMARDHAEAGLSAISGEHYVGSHWLGTFAVYLLTRRGIRV